MCTAGENLPTPAEVLTLMQEHHADNTTWWRPDSTAMPPFSMDVEMMSSCLPLSLRVLSGASKSAVADRLVEASLACSGRRDEEVSWKGRWCFFMMIVCQPLC